MGENNDGLEDDILGNAESGLKPGAEVVDPPTSTSEGDKTIYPTFLDEGGFTFLNSRTGQTESGTFVIDTCPVKPPISREIDPKTAEWELMFQYTLDGDPTTQPHTEVLRLHDFSSDPDGAKAGRIHQKAVDLFHSNLHPEQYDAEMRTFIADLNDEDES